MEEITQQGVVRNGPFDFFSDASYQKFLNNVYAFDPFYVPDDIVNIYSDFTFNNSSSFYLREEAAQQFADMAWAFAHAFDSKSKLSITSAYRSSSFQKRLASNCSIWRCAIPGTSEHEA